MRSAVARRRAQRAPARLWGAGCGGVLTAACRLRRILYALLLFAVPTTLAGSSPRAGGPQPSPGDSFAPRWSVVTPGRVTAPPVELWVAGSPYVAVTTEDRRLRLYESSGRARFVVRTGVRRAAALLPAGEGEIVIVPEEGRRTGPVRVSTYGNELTAVGQPVVGDSLADAEYRFHGSDGALVELTRSGTIRRSGPTGVPLWERTLPARVGAAHVIGGALFVGLDDGRIFQFSTDGGAPFYRVSAGVAALAADADTRILAVTSAGELLLVDVPATGSGDGRPAIVRRAALPVDIAASEVSIDAEWWGAVVVTSAAMVATARSDGEIVWSRNTGPNAIASVHATPRRGTAITIGSEGTVSVVGASGEIARMEPDDGVRYVEWMPGRRELVIAYEDWRLIGYGAPAIEPDGSEPVQPSRAESVLVEPGSGSGGAALRALAEATLNGTSERARRELLADLVRMRRERRLHGRVSAYRSILVGLAQEPYRSPSIAGDQIANDFPRIREGAIHELGVLLDPPALVALTQAVRFDTDSRVAAAALDRIAAYGIDEYGALAYAVERFSRAGDHERRTLAPAIVAALQNTDADARSPALFRRALEMIAAADVAGELRRAARALNDSVAE